MKRSISGIILFLFTSIVMLAADHSVGILVNEKYGRVLENKIKEEFKKEFKDMETRVNVAQVEYVNSENFSEGLKKLEGNKNLDAIFVLDYTTDLSKLKSNKTIVYPFGIGAGEGELSNKLIFVQGKLDIDSDLKDLKDLKDIRKIVYITSPKTIKKYEEFSASLTEVSKGNGIESKIISLDSGSENLKREILNADAVYIISNDNVKEILKFATENNKLTYLANLELSNAKYSLVAYDFQLETDKRIRTSVNDYSNRIQGKEEYSIVSLGKVSDKRFFNKSISRSINVHPTGRFLKDFKVMGETEKDAPKLGLENAIRYGLDNNSKLLASFNRMSGKDYKYMAKFAERLPQVKAEGNYEYLEQNAVNQYTKDENSVTGGIKISQVIFSNDLNAQIFSQKIDSLNSELTFKEDSNALIQEIVGAYLDVLKEKSNVSIQQSNYDMLKEFLKISKLKFETGSVGKQDVYRFEAELAVAETSLITAETNLKNSEVRLNKVLNLKQDTKHSYETLSSLKAKFAEVNIPMKEMSYNDNLRAKIGEYFIDGALNNSYNLKIAENKISDIDSQYKAASRSRYLPEVEGFARYNKNNIGSSGKDSNNDLENYWTAGVGVSLPLFTSGEIHYKKKSLSSEKEAVTYEKVNVEKDVEKDMNIELNRLIASYNQILTTETAKNAAKKYLDISISQYSVGSINITDLLEAKNTYIEAEMNNIIANYRLFNSQVAVEKNYGEYIFLKSSVEKKKINEELNTLLKN